MDDRRLGMAVRARRHRRGWRLVDLALAAGVGAGVCGLLERGHVDRLSVRTARAILRALDLPLGWDLGWHRTDIDRLFDEDHAALAASFVLWLGLAGWVTRTEVSFNRYGERGRIDILAFEPRSRVLLVVEVKTVIVDLQDLLGTLDMKARVAASIGTWGRPSAVVPAIVVLEGTTARRRFAGVAPLFDRYDLRGRSALRWLRQPVPGPSGLLLLRELPYGNGVDRRRAGRRRVRSSAPNPRSGGATIGHADTS
jgi:transcriptional regulator with XRE-family HTH domain